MSTNKTENYQLNQWVGADRILMDDFNADNAKIDAALKGHTDSIAAVKTWLNIPQHTARVATGAYEGTGAAHTITLDTGFYPLFVMIITGANRSEDGWARAYTMRPWDQLSVVGDGNSERRGANVIWNAENVQLTQYVPGGGSGITENSMTNMNVSGKTYTWLAIGYANDIT